MHLLIGMALSPEKKIRKHWLIATLALYILSPLAAFIMLAVVSRLVPVPEKELYEPLASAILGIIPLGLGWHFVYKKCGTKLLTFWLITAPFGMFSNIFNALFKEMLSLGILIGCVIDIGVSIWWYVLSIKLRQINKAIQTQKPTEPQINCTINETNKGGSYVTHGNTDDKISTSTGNEYDTNPGN